MPSLSPWNSFCLLIFVWELQGAWFRLLFNFHSKNSRDWWWYWEYYKDVYGEYNPEENRSWCDRSQWKNELHWVPVAGISLILCIATHGPLHACLRSTKAKKAPLNSAQLRIPDGPRVIPEITKTNHCAYLFLPGFLSPALLSCLDCWVSRKFQTEEVLFILSPCSAEFYPLKKEGKKQHFFPHSKEEKN